MKVTVANYRQGEIQARTKQHKSTEANPLRLASHPLPEGGGGIRTYRLTLIRAGCHKINAQTSRAVTN